MARAGIIYSSVAKAATQLAATGKNPTVDSVREALGSTGSKSTIAPLLKRWKAEHQGSMIGTELGLPAELLQTMKGVYEQLQNDVHQQLAEAREEHRIALESAADQVKQFQIENYVIQDAKMTLSTELAQVKDELLKLQSIQQSLTVSQAILQSDNSGLQQRLADRSVEVTALHQQLTQSRVQFEHYQEAVAVQRSEERQLIDQRMTQTEQNLNNAQQRIMTQQSAIAQQESHIAHLLAEKKHLQEAAHAAQETTRSLQGEFASLRMERDQLAYQFKEITFANQTLADKVELAQQALTDSRIALAIQETQISLLMERLTQTEGKAERLDQEKMALTHEKAELQAIMATYRKWDLAESHKSDQNRSS